MVAMTINNPARLKGKFSKQRGMVFLATILGHALFLLAIVSYAPQFVNILSLMNQVSVRQQSLEVGEAGIARGTLELLHNQAVNMLNSQGGWSNALDPDPSACNAIAGGINVLSCHVLGPVALSGADGAAAGTYQVWAINVGQSQRVRLVSRGSVPSSPTNQQQVTQEFNALVPMGFNFAAYGAGLAYLGHVANWIGVSATDAYDSSLGPYQVLLNRIEQGNVGTGGRSKLQPGGSEGALTVFDNGEIFGAAKIFENSVVSAPAGQPSQGTQAMGGTPDLPLIQVPAALESLPVTDTIAGFQGDQSGNGEFRLTGTYTCNGPLRVKQFLVGPGGTLLIDEGCELFIDNTGNTPPYNLNGFGISQWGEGSSIAPRVFGTDAVDTIGGQSGQILKTSTEKTTIFIREGMAEFAGQGLAYDASIAEADRKPVNLQLYQTCGAESYCRFEFQQIQPFYGVAYSDAGGIYLHSGFDGVSMGDGQYYGSFIGANETGIYAGEYNGTRYDTRVHYDTTLAGLAVDGSGNPVGNSEYRIRQGSWSARQAP